MLSRTDTQVATAFPQRNALVQYLKLLANDDRMNKFEPSSVTNLNRVEAVESAYEIGRIHGTNEGLQELAFHILNTFFPNELTKGD